MPAVSIQQSLHHRSRHPLWLSEWILSGGHGETRGHVHQWVRLLLCLTHKSICSAHGHTWALQDHCCLTYYTTSEADIANSLIFHNYMRSRHLLWFIIRHINLWASLRVLWLPHPCLGIWGAVSNNAATLHRLFIQAKMCFVCWRQYVAMQDGAQSEARTQPPCSTETLCK